MTASRTVRMDVEFLDYMRKIKEKVEKESIIPMSDTTISKTLNKYLRETKGFEEFLFGNNTRKKSKRKDNGGFFLI